MSETGRPASNPRRTWLPDVTPDLVPEREVTPSVGRYEDRGALGLGGMGEVRRVADDTLGRTLAMKVLAPRLAARPDAIEAFLREARRTAQLEHPGIVPIHELGRLADGRPYFTMKEVRGRTLHEWLRERRLGSEVPVRRLVEVLHRAAEAVAYAHARGVVHRDLKPDNLMVGPFGEVLVLDWGIAVALAEAAGGPAPGTPGWVAPELADGAAPTPASDVWSLGRILAVILAGGDPETPPSALPPGVDEELAALTRDATDPDPSRRPADASAFVERVGAWLDGARHRERALLLVERARARDAETDRLRDEAVALRDRAQLALEALPSWAPLDDKRPHWVALERAEEKLREVALAEVERDQDLHAALREVPGLPEARGLLADGWIDRHADASARRDSAATARYEALIRSHGQARHAAWLEGRGRLTLRTDVPALATARPVVTIDRRCALGEPVALGVTPVVDVELPHGSWVVTLEGPAGALRIPIELERAGRWDDRCPDGSPLVHRLPRGGELGPDEVLVPAGWARIGGDPLAYGPFPARRVWVDAFVIGRFPVLEREYLAFLEASPDDALAPCHEPALGGLLWPRGPDGRWDLSGRHPRLPVHGVDYACARAYVEWRRRVTGLPWRLPTEVEWEKAARGVDGRAFPFGDHPDPSFCCIAGSHAAQPAVVPVDAFPLDESTYGVRGLAGNVRDWVADRYERHGAAVVDGRQPPVLDDDPAATRIQRGGAWSFHEQHARAATRWWQDPKFRHTAASFRIARDW